MGSLSSGLGWAGFAKDGGAGSHGGPNPLLLAHHLDPEVLKMPD
jgi:hypothetical protein